MKNGIIIVVFMLIIGALLIDYQPIQAQLLGPAPPVKIGVVNVSKVLSECQENLERQKLTQAKEASLSQQLNAMSKQAEAIKAELDANVLKPGSEEYNAQVLKLYELNGQIQSFQDGQQQLFAIETQAWMEGLYQKFLGQVATVAQQQRYTVVLNNDESDVQMPDLNTLTNMIRTRKIVYRAVEIDITALILEKMNGEYALEQQSN
ncbi:MAG: OmpH family outer membrane protein [Planctomycetes bacterium]|nr:OmpH family outer membrane protein [Planctomycetota bacterium]